MSEKRKEKQRQEAEKREEEVERERVLEALREKVNHIFKYHDLFLYKQEWGRSYVHFENEMFSPD